MMTRIRIIQRCTQGRSPHRLSGEPLLHIAPYGPWQFAVVRDAASCFVYFVSVRFSCGGLRIHIFQRARRGIGEV
jgi:hypothetical protein